MVTALSGSCIFQDLTVQNIKRYLHGKFPNSEADLLGENLGISPAVIKTFKHNCGSNSERLLSEVLNYWLNNDNEKSWSKLAGALEFCNYRILAALIRDMPVRQLHIIIKGKY